MRQCKNKLLLIDQEAEEILADTAPDKSHSDNIFDTADNILTVMIQSIFDGVSFSVEANMDEDVDLSNQSFSTSQLTYESLSLPTYGVLATDNLCKIENRNVSQP